MEIMPTHFFRFFWGNDKFVLNGWRSNVVSLGQFSLPGWSWCNSFFFSFLGLFRFLFDSLTDAFLFSLSLLALVADGITFMLGRDVFFPRRVDRTHRNSWTGRQLARSTKFVVFFCQQLFDFRGKKTTKMMAIWLENVRVVLVCFLSEFGQLTFISLNF